MANELQPVPYKDPIIDRNGVLSQAWSKWFERVRTLVKTAGDGTISALTGDVTASGSGSVIATIANGVITNAKVAVGAAIAYAKLNLTGSIVNGDIAVAAAIAYSKLNLTGSILNADVNAAAAIARTKLASGSNDHVLINSATGVMSSEAQLAVSRGGTNSGTALNNNRVMQSSGGAIVEAAAITASRALASDANGIPVSTAVTATELGYVAGVTSAIQTQIAAKEPTITGTTSADYYRGDKTFQPLNKAAVGLSNVDNTSDATKNSAVATLTNKTLTSPVINTPTGIVKGDVGLGNVDNTSDATKNAAPVTLTNKTIAAGSNTITGLTNSNLSGSAGITNANLANVAVNTIKGRITSGTGAVEDLTDAQATAVLNSFIGDSGSGGTKGLVPPPSTGDATKFLKGSGSFASIGPADFKVTYAFRAFRKTTGLTLSAGVAQEIVMNTERYDVGGNHSTSTGRFTAPVAGYYTFSFGAAIQMGATASSVINAWLLINGTGDVYASDILTSLANSKIYTLKAGGETILLAANDYVSLWCQADTQNATLLSSGGNNENSWFSGRMVGIA